MALLATLAAAAAVVSTYTVFNGTYDEPAHVANGMQWLHGQDMYEPMHPPIGRVAATIGPYLAGARPTGAQSMWVEGNRILGGPEHYARNLALARVGILPFLFLTAVAVWFWGRRSLGYAGAALAVLFLVANPTVLAHSGLATTDAAGMAGFTIAALAYLRWRAHRTLLRGAALGAGAAFALLTKFSAPPFLVVGLGLYELSSLIVARRRPALREAFSRATLASLAAGAAVAVVAVWATYRFSVGTIHDGSSFRVLAPELFRGIEQLGKLSRIPGPSYLFGEAKFGGWWYYFPVALLVKTPLTILAAAIVGAVAAVRAARAPSNDREALAPLALALGVMLVSLPSTRQIGVRHIMPAYPMLAMLAARGVLELWSAPSMRRWRVALVGALVAATLWAPVRSYPDFIPYFNALAASRPHAILLDSNLDWGQDLYRLRYVMRTYRIQQMGVVYWGTADFAAVGLEGAYRIYDGAPRVGWIAASETLLAGVSVGDRFAWLLRHEPVGRVGHSLRVYFIEP